MSINRLFPHPVLSLLLWVVWLLLNNSISAGHIILGAALAIFIPWFTKDFWPEKITISCPWLLAKFIGTLIYHIIVANLVVARLILGDQKKLQPGFFVVPLDIHSPVAISLLANSMSLTPGTLTCNLSDDHKSLLIHALHITDPEAMIP